MKRSFDFGEPQKDWWPKKPGIYCVVINGEHSLVEFINQLYKTKPLVGFAFGYEMEYTVNKREHISIIYPNPITLPVNDKEQD